MVSEIENHNWFRRHWIISIILGLWLLGMIGMMSEEEGNSGITSNVVLDSIEDNVIILNSPSINEKEQIKTYSDVKIQPTENVNQPSETSIPSNTQISPQESLKQKVKSATLSIDRVQIQVANLYPTRVTVTNTGDVLISPKFDLYVYDNSNNEVCSGSPLFDEISSISAGQKQTGEISIMGCMFEKDGTYTLKVDLLDVSYNKLDSATKDFSVNYWGQFNLG